MFDKLRAGLISMAMLAMSAASTALYAQGVTHFNLPAQSLAESLKAIGLQTKINVLVTPQLIDGRDAPAIDAKLTADEALSRLLAGSGLKYQFINAHTVVVSASEEKPGAPRVSATARGDSSIQLAQAETGSSDAAAGRAANDVGANDSPQSANMGRLDEIVVTARKASERLQDIPVSVTAITGEQLRDRGAVDIKDILSATRTNEVIFILKAAEFGAALMMGDGPPEIGVQTRVSNYPVLLRFKRSWW